MFTIAKRTISENNPPYIIAELSANHNGSLERAKQSIRMAAESGADAVKIQSYTADTMTIDCDKKDFMIQGGLWDGYKLYDLYHEAHTPYEWHRELFDFAQAQGITIFSTPFDESAVDLLESLNAPAYKIASFELTDLSLIQYVAKKRKPMLLSTGMASEGEIAEALEAVRSSGCDSVLLFHCISSYPAPIDQANLRTLAKLKKTFGVTVGLSDHTIGNLATTTAIALGACAIEKHFTISRQDKGPDSEFSIEPHELQRLVRDARDAWLSLGKDDLIRPPSESQSRVFRRSLYFVRDVKAGQKITSDDVRRIRPGYGLAPKFLEKVIGKTALRDLERGNAVTWDVLSDE
jgi:pseudaminic acid synthase